MKHSTRTLIFGASAIIALSTLTACSGNSSETPAETSAPAAVVDFPESAKYIADIPTADGRTMTIGIAVDGGMVAAYACDGTSDEAWFFGTQQDGSIEITSKYLDTLTATFDGTDIDGTLTMNDEALAFAAPEVAAPAGMYTAEVNGDRASWVLRPDDTAVGVVFVGSTNDKGAFENFTDDVANHREEVRDRRIARLLGQADPLATPAMTSTINGTEVTAEIVNGDTRLN